MKILICALLCLISINAYAEKVIVSYDPEGKIYFTVFAKGYGEKDAEGIIARSDILRGLPYEIIDDSKLPKNSDGTFKDRSYWIGKKGEAIKIDEAKKQADIEAKEAKEKALNDKLKAIGMTKEDFKEIIK